MTLTKLNNQSLSAVTELPTGYINHQVFTNSSGTSINDATNGTIWTVSYNKLKAGTDLIISGTLMFRGNGGSGTTVPSVKYGTGDKFYGGVSLRQTVASDWSGGCGINLVISGHTTTGAQDLVFGWSFADSSSSKPFSKWNPDSGDHARIQDTTSIVTVMEIAG